MEDCKLDSFGSPYVTDPRDRWVAGYVGTGGFKLPYRMPVITQITGNLWIGGVQKDLVLPDFFQHVVSLEDSESYIIKHKLKSRLTVSMEDSEDQSLEMVPLVAAVVDVLRQKEPTLVHCYMGLNRSALIAAATLGVWSPMEDIIKLIRRKRSTAALSNEAFVHYLLNSY